MRKTKKNIMINGMFTTGEVGDIICMSPRTVAKYVDSGKLESARRPPSYTHRLIPPLSLIKFMNQNEFPLELFRDYVLDPTKVL